MSTDSAHAWDVPRILVVDDYPGAAECLARWLRALGHEVETATDGRQALESAERFRPGVIFLDLAMPKLNGYQVATRIRQRPWGKNIVLVALTAFGGERDRQRSREAGFDEHIVKPAFPAEIRSILACYSGQTSPADIQPDRAQEAFRIGREGQPREPKC